MKRLWQWWTLSPGWQVRQWMKCEAIANVRRGGYVYRARWRRVVAHAAVCGRSIGYRVWYDSAPGQTRHLMVPVYWPVVPWRRYGTPCVKIQAWMPPAPWWVLVERNEWADEELYALWGMHWLIIAGLAVYRWWLRISWRCTTPPGTRTRPWPL